MKTLFKKMLSSLIKPFGYQLTRKDQQNDFYLYEYSSYEEYRDTQIFHNKRKIDTVFADKARLNKISEVLNSKFDNDKILGICHGSRNGFEQNFLNQCSQNIFSIGTDISETAKDFENSVQWDFHDVKKEWINKYHFVYTNSLDQSWNPKKALLTWFDQLKENGLLIIEHTKYHSSEHASEMDPFGVKPTVMPYVLTKWFGSQISIEHIKVKKDNMNVDAWLFFVSKNNKNVIELL